MVKNNFYNEERIEMFGELFDYADKVGIKDNVFKMEISVEKMFFIVFRHYPQADNLLKVDKVIQYE